MDRNDSGTVQSNRRIDPRAARAGNIAREREKGSEGVGGRLIGRSVNWRFAIVAAAESSDRSKQSINRARLIRPDKAPGLLFRCKQLMIRPRIAIIERAASLASDREPSRPRRARFSRRGPSRGNVRSRRRTFPRKLDAREAKIARGRCERIDRLSDCCPWCVRHDHGLGLIRM